MGLIFHIYSVYRFVDWIITDGEDGTTPKPSTIFVCQSPQLKCPLGSEINNQM